MKVVATYNIKGGVGKTSTAVNLGYLAARDGLRTLLWDLDPQGSATYLFRVKPKVKGGGKALVEGRRTLDEAIKANRLRPARSHAGRLQLPQPRPRPGLHEAPHGPAPPPDRAPEGRVRPGHPRLPAQRVAGVGERRPRLRRPARPADPRDALGAHLRPAPRLRRRDARAQAPGDGLPVDGRPPQEGPSRVRRAAPARSRGRGGRGDPEPGGDRADGPAARTRSGRSRRAAPRQPPTRRSGPGCGPAWPTPADRPDRRAQRVRRRAVRDPVIGCPPFPVTVSVGRARCKPMRGPTARTGALPDPGGAAGRGRERTCRRSVARSRARLLAALLVARGDVVPADRLVAALWGDDPPAGAATALRAYLSRLRGVLGGAADLRHRPPGYSLSLEDATLDAAEFERLVGAARTAAAAGDHARAGADLDAALALWRGDALAEFTDGELARPRPPGSPSCASPPARSARRPCWSRAGPSRRCPSSRRWCAGTRRGSAPRWR